MEHELITKMALKIMALESQLAEFEAPEVADDCEEYKIGPYTVHFYPGDRRVEERGWIDGVYANGVNVTEDLSEDKLASLEEVCFNNLALEVAIDAYDAAVIRYESRIAA